MRLDAQISAPGPTLPPTQRSSGDGHFGFFDVMRAVAIVAIVWIHTADSPGGLRYRDLGRFGVPFFMMGAVLFEFQSLRQKPDQRFTTYAWRRFLRLYVPFLVWSVIYLAARFLKHKVFHAGSALQWRLVLLYVGPAHQLWFLPLLLIVNLALFWPARGIIARPDLKWPVVVASLVLAITVARISPPTSEIPAISWALIGVAFAAVFPDLRPAIQTRAAAGVGTVMLITSIAAVLGWGRNPLLEAAAGLGTLLIALQPIALPASIVTSIGRHAFEIYLNHVLFVEGIQAVLVRLHVTSTPATDLLVLVLSVAMGFGLSVVILSIRGKSASS